MTTAHDATTVAESPWASRLGSAVATVFRRRARLRVTAAVASTGGAVVAGLAVALAAGSGAAEPRLGLVAAVAVLVVLALGGLVVGLATGLRARELRFVGEGAALSVLLPGNPTLTAADLAGPLRSPASFDAWVTGAHVAPAVPGAHLERWRWVPGVVRERLAGPSAFAYRRWSGICGGAALVVAAVTGVFTVAVFDAPRARVAGIVIAGGCVLASAILRWCCESRAAREYRAGYSTLTPVRHAGARGGGWVEADTRLAVDLVDHASGAVLRAAGAAPLSIPECERRRRAAVTA